jgi:hypothetical protein
MTVASSIILSTVVNDMAAPYSPFVPTSGCAGAGAALHASIPAGARLFSISDAFAIR